MKFNLESSSGYHIQSYQAGQVEITSVVNNSSGKTTAESMILTHSAVIAPHWLLKDWPPTSAAQLTTDHLLKVLECNPEVIILGTGEKLVFPSPEILQVCYQAGTGIEVMDTGAACRTYNVLSSEGRQVAAALII